MLAASPISRSNAADAGVGQHRAAVVGDHEPVHRPAAAVFDGVFIAVCWPACC
jgi:hypothetical protein